MTGSQYTLVYDGDCRICGRVVKILHGWAGDRLEILPFQDPAVRARFPTIPEQDFAESLQLIAPQGRRWQRGAAVEQLFALLPRGRWISWIFHIPFVRALTERLYRWIARHRYKLGCGEHCPYRGENTANT